MSWATDTVALLPFRDKVTTNEGIEMFVEISDYGQMIGICVCDPQTIVRIKPWKRSDKVLQFLRLQPKKFGEYRVAMRIRGGGDPANSAESIRLWLKMKTAAVLLQRRGMPI